MQIIGMGGSGINIVNHLLRKLPRLANVGVMAEKYDLPKSTAESKLQFWDPQGLGDSTRIESARWIFDNSKENIRRFINSDTVILTAGMGGQSSYTLPFVAQMANEMGVRTIGVVSMPFSFEGTRRQSRANEGLKLSQESIPVLSVINADEVLKRQPPDKLSCRDAFSILDDWMSKTVLLFSDFFPKAS
ncbi:hypothetical protein FACS1894187_14080 [Synergistales bacterium]|nr:hypothetical protein FACS1894187_14080 [Synergistales bacterium]